MHSKIKNYFTFFVKSFDDKKISRGKLLNSMVKTMTYKLCDELSCNEISSVEVIRMPK